jgi:hypothetical protein
MDERAADRTKIRTVVARATRALVFSLLAAGCASTWSALPSQGGPAWTELTSEHFVLWTDLPLEAAGRQLRSLEQFRSVLVAFAMQVPPKTVPGRSLAICLKSWSEWRQFAPEDLVGIFIPAGGNPTRVPLIMYPADVQTSDGNEDDDAVRQHELAHLVLFSIMHKQPDWFAEGMAYFFQATQIDGKSHGVEIGRAPEDLLRRLRDLLRYRDAWALLPLEDVFHPPRATVHSAEFYTTSWWLVSFLLNQHAAEFAQYQRLLADHPDTSPDELWASAFPDLPPDAAERALRSWRTKGAELHVHRFSFDFPAPKLLAARRLTDPDVRVVRSLLFGLLKNDRSASRVELAAASREDWTHAGAAMAWRSFGDEVGVERARQILAAHPTDWRAMVLLWDALQPGDERDHLRRDLCVHVGENPAIDLGAKLCRRE